MLWGWPWHVMARGKPMSDGYEPSSTRFTAGDEDPESICLLRLGQQMTAPYWTFDPALVKVAKSGQFGWHFNIL